jgi:uncharacterized UBP type Zn finger protein
MSVQPFLDLSLGIADIVRKRAGRGGKFAPKLAQSLTLKKCLDTEYMQPELCDYKCRSCGGSDEKGKRYSTIKRLPNVLCIQFKVLDPRQALPVVSKVLGDTDDVLEAF